MFRIAGKRRITLLAPPQNVVLTFIAGKYGLTWDTNPVNSVPEVRIGSGSVTTLSELAQSWDSGQSASNDLSVRYREGSVTSVFVNGIP